MALPGELSLLGQYSTQRTSFLHSADIINTDWHPHKPLIKKCRSSSHALKHTLLYIYFTLNGTIFSEWTLCSVKTSNPDHKLIRKLFTKVLNQVRKYSINVHTIGLLFDKWWFPLLAISSFRALQHWITDGTSWIKKWSQTFNASEPLSLHLTFQCFFFDDWILQNSFNNVGLNWPFPLCNVLASLSQHYSRFPTLNC